MKDHFLKQGYPSNIVEKSRKRVASLKRSDLLSTDCKKLNNDNDRIVFPIVYHINNMPICNVIKRNFNILSRDNEVGHCFRGRPLIAFKRDKNLGDILVSSRIRSEDVVKGTKKCGRSRCLTCPHINNSDIIIGPTGTFNIKSSFSCISEGIIYAIECDRCGKLYIGETGRKLSDRFREHRRFVVTKKADNEIAFHFNQPDHDGVKDMKVCGMLYCHDITDRKLKEQKLILKLGTVLGRGLNTDFNFPHLLE